MKGFKGTQGEWSVIGGWNEYGEGCFPSVLIHGTEHNYKNSYGRNGITINVSHDQQAESLMANALLISKSPRMLFRLASNKLVLENTVTYLNNLLAIVEPHERLKLETNILLLESEIIDTKELIKQATEL